MKQQKLVLFDIDGTLLYSKDIALRQRFSHAIEKVHGKKIEVLWENFEGAIDNTILRSTMRTGGIPDEHIEQRLLETHDAAYDYFVETVNKDTYKETLLPGTKELLTRLQAHVYIGLLTGNYEKTAYHKLEIVGLRNFFDFGVFGHEGENRDALAKLIQSKARKHFKKNFSPQQIFIVGDTPRDIACADSIGAQSIAVATGKYSLSELSAYSPDLLIESLLNSEVIKFIEGANEAKKKGVL